MRCARLTGKRYLLSPRLYLTIVIFISLYYLLVNKESDLKVEVVKAVILSPTVKLQPPTVKLPTTVHRTRPIILLWTLKNSKNLSVSLQEGQNFLARHKCDVSDCTFTTDQSTYASATAVVFHLLDFEPVTHSPPSRTPNQWYVFYNREPPTNHNILRKSRSPAISNGFFNLTMSIRRDSDIYAPYVSFRQETNPKPRVVNFARKSGNLVAWFVSRCHTFSRRENYVKKLRKYISIDIFGKCSGVVDCPKSDKRCYSKINTYKFYLAFENSICKDYVTEKVIYPMMFSDVIPVVMGGVNYSEYLPPHSYINVIDFDNPKHLAKYLLELDKDDEKYLAYFNWRQTHIPVYSPQPFCKLCQLLHNKTFPSKVYNDFDHWWNFGQCSEPFVWK